MHTTCTRPGSFPLPVKSVHSAQIGGKDQNTGGWFWLHRLGPSRCPVISVLKYLWSQGADTTRHGPGHALCTPTSLCGRQPNCGTGLAESKQQQPGAGRGDHPSPGSEVPAKARTPFCRKKTHWNVQHHSPGRV